MGTNRVLKLTDQGEIQFFEDKANGTNKVTLKGPASTADVTLVLPSSDGDAGQFLQTDGSGNLTFANGTATLDSAYTAGQSITVDTARVSIQSGADITDHVVDIGNAHNDDENALNVAKSVAGSGHAIRGGYSATGGDGCAGYFIMSGTSTEAAMEATVTGGGSGNGIYSNYVSGSGNAININNQGTGKDINGHGSSWFIYNDGTAKIRAVAGASRGAASAYAVGSMIWNTTTNMINISDGSTNWYDAAGNIV